MKRAEFLMLVQTAALCCEMTRAVAGAKDSLAVHILHKAMEVEPKRLPEDLEKAAWEFVDRFYGGPVKEVD